MTKVRYCFTCSEHQPGIKHEPCHSQCRFYSAWKAKTEGSSMKGKRTLAQALALMGKFRGEVLVDDINRRWRFSTEGKLEVQASDFSVYSHYLIKEPDVWRRFVRLAPHEQEPVDQPLPNIARGDLAELREWAEKGLITSLGKAASKLSHEDYDKLSKLPQLMSMLEDLVLASCSPEGQGKYKESEVLRDGGENSIAEDARSLALKIRRHIMKTEGCDEDNAERANKSACFELISQLVIYGKY